MEMEELKRSDPMAIVSLGSPTGVSDVALLRRDLHRQWMKRNESGPAASEQSSDDSDQLQPLQAADDSDHAVACVEPEEEAVVEGQSNDGHNSEPPESDANPLNDDSHANPLNLAALDSPDSERVDHFGDHEIWEAHSPRHVFAPVADDEFRVWPVALVDDHDSDPENSDTKIDSDPENLNSGNLTGDGSDVAEEVERPGWVRSLMMGGGRQTNLLGPTSRDRDNLFFLSQELPEPYVWQPSVAESSSLTGISVATGNIDAIPAPSDFTTADEISAAAIPARRSPRTIIRGFDHDLQDHDRQQNLRAYDHQKLGQVGTQKISYYVRPLKKNASILRADARMEEVMRSDPMARVFSDKVLKEKILDEFLWPHSTPDGDIVPKNCYYADKEIEGYADKKHEKAAMDSAMELARFRNAFCSSSVFSKKSRVMFDATSSATIPNRVALILESLNEYTRERMAKDAWSGGATVYPHFTRDCYCDGPHPVVVPATEAWFSLHRLDDNFLSDFQKFALFDKHFLHRLLDSLTTFALFDKHFLHRLLDSAGGWEYAACLDDDINPWNPMLREKLRCKNSKIEEIWNHKCYLPWLHRVVTHKAVLKKLRVYNHQQMMSSLSSHQVEAASTSMMSRDRDRDLIGEDLGDPTNQLLRFLHIDTRDHLYGYLRLGLEAHILDPAEDNREDPMFFGPAVVEESNIGVGLQSNGDDQNLGSFSLDSLKILLDLFVTRVRRVPRDKRRATNCFGQRTFDAWLFYLLQQLIEKAWVGLQSAKKAAHERVYCRLDSAHRATQIGMDQDSTIHDIPGDPDTFLRETNTFLRKQAELILRVCENSNLVMFAAQNKESTPNGVMLRSIMNVDGYEESIHDKSIFGDMPQQIVGHLAHIKSFARGKMFIVATEYDGRPNIDQSVGSGLLELGV